MAINYVPKDLKVVAVIGNPVLTAAEIKWDADPMAKRTGFSKFAIYGSTDDKTFTLIREVKNPHDVVPLQDLPSFIKVSGFDMAGNESEKSDSLALMAKTTVASNCSQIFYSASNSGLSADNAQAALDEIVAKLKAASVAGF